MFYTVRLNEPLELFEKDQNLEILAQPYVAWSGYTDCFVHNIQSWCSNINEFVGEIIFFKNATQRDFVLNLAEMFSFFHSNKSLIEVFPFCFLFDFVFFVV